jgi:hypothetical protein
MALYAKYETDTSFDYLEKIIDILDEPICILGGWAVYLTVNKKFKEDLGPDYLGSRDIDLDLNPKDFVIIKRSNMEQIKNYQKKRQKISQLMIFLPSSLIPLLITFIHYSKQFLILIQ